jgi:RNA polymerase sigma-54 factor
MNAKMTVTQRMIHKMLLSPQMRMSINILGMSSADLVEYIDSVLEKNPFLQKIYDTKKNRNQLTGSYLSPDTQDTIQSDDDPRAVLLSQLKMLHLENELMEIASYLIYEMDESGYIKCDIIGAAHELMAEPETVEEVLDAIQNLDPPGIGARDLKECLQIQLRRQGRENSLAFIIVTENLAELATNDVVAISAMLNEDESDVRKAIEEIKLLNPRPASTLLAKSPLLYTLTWWPVLKTARHA